MDEKRWAETIRGAVDARLSGLRENPHMAQRVITQAKGEAQGKAKGKKKMSVGFVLLMALLLAAAAVLCVFLLRPKTTIASLMVLDGQGHSHCQSICGRRALYAEGHQ